MKAVLLVLWLTVALGLAQRPDGKHGGSINPRTTDESAYLDGQPVPITVEKIDGRATFWFMKIPGRRYKVYVRGSDDPGWMFMGSTEHHGSKYIWAYYYIRPGSFQWRNKRSVMVKIISEPID